LLRKDCTSAQNTVANTDAAASLERLFPPVAESSMLTVACRRGDYSASLISRAVEDCDAHLLNLNVTADTDNFDNRIVAELRVSHRNPESIARSLERYGYEVIATEATVSPDESVMRSHYDELMHYLGI